MTWWEIGLIASSIAPAPLWWGWRWFAVRRQMIAAARLRDQMMRRERFVGVVRVPGTTKTEFIDRDEAD